MTLLFWAALLGAFVGASAAFFLGLLIGRFYASSQCDRKRSAK